MLWFILILIAIAVIFGRDVAQGTLKIIGLVVLLLIVVVVALAIVGSNA